ncbi:hypothetical protein [Xenorhabdus hominickii]|uniref:Uncharacterized protein n=1 Tax=Xenorhabdus hominickii TaxID=351679 RepID=A0A2G0Q421_XENHO|nr:hypothetical protein [Xenorhabdus hominickii]AOM42598.1 hypothetical protein A9255_19845 [Xenorhabdus hominickii]PHM52240.1 hypothetical protein Xhom_04620 [Xenorhabdus hominickii]PHM53952.1 hypothetical protein Xhom_03020 [Xenorhabdus hominickii]
MTQLTLLERKRKAFIHAKLDSLQKKHGCHSVIVKVNGTNCRLDLDEEILILALIKFFEDGLDEHQHKLHELINTYDSFITKFGNLTAEGNEFMREILKIIAKKTEPIK